MSMGLFNYVPHAPGDDDKRYRKRFRNFVNS